MTLKVFCWLLRVFLQPVVSRLSSVDHLKDADEDFALVLSLTNMLYVLNSSCLNWASLRWELRLLPITSGNFFVSCKRELSGALQNKRERLKEELLFQCLEQWGGKYRVRERKEGSRGVRRDADWRKERCHFKKEMTHTLKHPELRG